MDPLDGVSVFLAVAQCGSFSAAAEKLGCSKSTASAQVTRLERRIGARLLQRSSRAVSLTEAGRAYLCQVDDLLDRVRQAEKAAQAEVKEPRGPLRISAPSPFVWTHLAPLLPDFLARHPDIRIELQATAEVVDLVAGGFDLAIRLCPTNPPGAIVRRLSSTRLALVAAPALFKTHAVPRGPGDLAALPCLHYAIVSSRREWRFRRGREERIVQLAPTVVANDLEFLHRLSLAGSGVALLTEYTVVEDLKKGRLIRLLPDWDVVEVPVLAVYPGNRQIAANVRAFVDYLAKRLARSELTTAGTGAKALKASGS